MDVAEGDVHDRDGQRAPGAEVAVFFGDVWYAPLAVLLSNNRVITWSARGPNPERLRARRSRGVRACAALTTLVFVAAGLLGALHEAATVHVRCAAHGELIDSAGPVRTAVRPVRDAIAPAQPSARGHGDDHCLLASAARASRTVPGSPAIAAAAVTIDDLVAVPSAPIAAPAAGLYRIAPKTSPPA
jgi:hypothetical protein